METTIRPDLQSALLCEDVRQEIGGGQTLVGVLNVIPAPVVPIGLFKLCLWARWCGGIGVFEQRSRIVAPDESRVIAEAALKFELGDIEAHATNVHVFGGVQLPSHGVYHAEIRIDGELCMRFPIPVVPVHQAPGNQQKL